MRIRIALLSAVFCLCAAGAARSASPTPTERVAAVGRVLDRAKDSGAEKRCPGDYRQAHAAYDVAVGCVEGNGDCGPSLDKAERAARRVLARITFIEDMRATRYPWQEAADRYDRLAGRIATMTGFALPETLSGEAAGDAAIAGLDRRLTRLRVQVDSLTAVNRGMQAWVDAGRAAQDTTIAGLQRELTQARHDLWQMQLRAGVAEADRSAAEDQVRRLKEREEKVKGLGSLFGADEGQVWLTPEGDVRVRLSGLKFASGSAWLNPKYDPLLDKAADVARRFPDAKIRIEGNTDDTGPRDTNVELSQERARVVADALAGRLSVPADSIQAVGLGPDHPVAPNTTAEGRARNRRIELVIERPQVEGEG